MTDENDGAGDKESAKGPIGQAIDALVYAPIGLFFEGPSLLPKLVEDGKGHARGARAFGEFAVRQGRAELKRRVSAFEEQAGEVLRTLGVLPDDEAAPAPGAPTSDGARPSAASPTSSDGAAAGPRGNGSHPAPAPAPVADASAEPSPAVEDLAITDYDSLSASQVVTRLEGLGADELEAVRAYESAHRGRKTILNKVAQLQG